MPDDDLDLDLLSDLEDDDDLDDWLDDDEDDFAELDAMLDEAESTVKAIDLSRPLCTTCGNGQAIPGPVKRSRCQRCDRPWSWDLVEEEPAPKKPKKDGEPDPIMSGHCAHPQTKDPHLSHQRCVIYGSGSRANPEKRFHPCPCPCHLKHDLTEDQNVSMNPDGTYGGVDLYECGGCGGVIAEAPVLGTDPDGDPIYVHVNKHTGRMLYVECR